MTNDGQFSAQPSPTGTRQATVFFSDMVGFSALVEKLGDRVAGKMVQHVLEIQRAAIEKGSGGVVQRIVGDEVFGILDSPSLAMSRALEIQRQLAEWNAEDPDRPVLQIRMGLHIGEIYLEEEGRLEIISRHINRAHRIMEAAGPNQILASSVVIEMGRDYIEEVPDKSLGIRRYGEFYLKGVGPTEICEVADLRVREPAPPVSLTKDTEQSILSRLEEFGYVDPERVGAGHYGVVYKARRRDEQQEIAVKVLNPIWVDDPECRRLFESEANRLKQLRLPGVIQIFGSHVSGSPPLFEMEWIDGLTIDASLEEKPPERIAECFADICRVMAAAHDAGVVHGDLKPNNVMIREDGSPVVLDFGLSTRISDDDASSLSSSIVGTPAFVAPERIRDHTRAASGDIYSLGVMLYRILAGRDPFDERTVFGQLQCHLHEEPQLPSVFREGVSDDLQRICLKAMEKDLCDRYQTATEMAADLDRVVAGEVIRTRPTAYDNLLFHPVRQHLDQVRHWGQRGLLSSEEENRLRAAYDGLTLRGMPAVMEARKLGFWQLLAYLGGWAIVNGAAVWLVLHWNQIESGLLRLGLGSVPVLCMLATAAWMWRKQRYRITFAALVTLIVATPVFSFVWLYEFELLSTVAVDELSKELFQDEFSASSEKQLFVNFADNKPTPLLTNRQLFCVATSMLIAATSVMFLTKTRTHSAQAAFACILCYITLLMVIPPGNLVPLIREHQWASIAVRFLPLICLVLLVSRWMIRSPGRENQAIPWLYLLSITLVIVTIVVCEFGPVEWFGPEKVWDAATGNEVERSAEPWEARGHLVTIFGGGFLVGMGLGGRSLFRHRARLATFGLMLTGLICIPLFLVLLGWVGTYPDLWDRPSIWGQSIPLPHLVLPLVGVAITLSACRTQMLVFLISGLATLAFSLFFLGTVYFHDQQYWPILILVAGMMCFVFSLTVELASPRNAVDDPVSGRRF